MKEPSRGHPLGRRWRRLPWVVGLVALGALSGSSRAEAGGVVVEKLGPDSALGRAGVRVGDVLLATRRGEGSSEVAILSPFAVDELPEGEAARGDLTLVLARNGSQLTVPAPPSDWSLSTRPALTPEVLEAYERAVATAAPGDVGSRSELVELARARGDDLAPWLLVRAAELMGEAGSVDAARELFDEARSRSEAAPAVVARIHTREARMLEELQDYPRAKTSRLAALAIREDVSPGSLELAWARIQAGGAMQGVRDLPAALGFFQGALEIAEGIDPGSFTSARARNGVGYSSFLLGDFAEAERQFELALAILARVAPTSRARAYAFFQLGGVAWRRGDLEKAEERVRRSAEVIRAIDPTGLDFAQRLEGLAAIAASRDDLAGGRRYLEEALEIYASHPSAKAQTASVSHNLGYIAAQEQDLEGAEEHLVRAVAIYGEMLPNSPELAASLRGLGTVYYESGTLDQAQLYLERALTLEEAKSLSPYETLSTLGKVALARDDLEAAEQYLQRAVELWVSVAPGTRWEADARFQLAELYRRSGDAARALDSLQAAVDALESQVLRLGGSRETRATFTGRHHHYYRELIAALVDGGDGAAAFHVLERSRARQLLALLAERDLALGTEIPADLADTRRALNERSDALLARLGGDASTSVRDELEEIRREQELVRARIRQLAPRLASLEYPHPTTAQDALGALDPGTVLLSYSIGPTRSHLFVLTGSTVQVHELAVTDQDLRDDVSRFRAFIRESTRPEPIRRRAATLGEALLAPAGAAIAGAARLLILPDGPLHYLPFAALKDPASSAAGALVERVPVHIAQSATIFAELKKERRPPVATRVAAFGDPLYRPTTVKPGGGGDLQRGSLFDLGPLPSSRAEVEALGRLYPDDALLFLGEEATETAAKRLDTGVSIVHFASHAVVDETAPLESGLALATPVGEGETRDNGFLQAWEIFEEIRLDADLVTLSACETALGQETAGEGVSSLARAFQYAGARSVLASLWKVSDESSARLLASFYQHLKGGSPKVDALRLAQAELARDPPTSHPYHWAAFQLMGDWR